MYFAGQLVSQTGTWLQNAAQSWLVLDLTHSAAAVGVLGFCLYAPYAVLGLIVTDYLYRTYPDLPEGELAKARAAVVNSMPVI